MNAVASAVMLILLLCSIAADEWQSAKVQHVFSRNGLHFVRIVPGESYGDTVGFKESKTGPMREGSSMKNSRIGRTS